MKNNYSIGVIAGTEVDTHMGIKYFKENFKEKGLKVVGSCLSDDPINNTVLQGLNTSKLYKIILNKIKNLIKKDDVQAICIYCNSISTSINLKKLRQEVSIPVITPLETYQEIGRKFDKIGVLGANCQAVSGIEKVIQSVNDSAQVIGVGVLPLVLAIEKEEPPTVIIKNLGIDSLINNFFASIGVEIIILGCTHFPYIQKELINISNIKIFNPSRKMLNNLKKVL